MKISLRIRKLSYSLATLGCLVGTAIAGIWGPRSESPQPSQFTANDQTPATVLNTGLDTERKISRADFEKFYDVPLRKRLYDPPPPAPVVRQLPPMRVELMGTILEDTNSMALVRSEKGGIEYKRIGDTVGPSDGPGKLLEIKADSVVVERAEERITVRVNNREMR